MTSSRRSSPRKAASSSGTPDLRKIMARLGRLRTRIRAIFATIGGSRWLLAALGLLILFFLADWLLDLPLGVRQFVRLGLLQPPETMSVAVLIPLFAISAFLSIALTRRHHGAAPLFAFVVGGLAGLLVWMAVRLFLPLRVRLPDQELALSVESRFRKLNDRLAAALDFQKELRDPTRGESEEMMRAVVIEAADEARDLSFSKAVSGRRAMRWAGAAVLVCALAAGGAYAFEDTVGLWARRSLLLEDVAWPRDTHMVAVDLLEDGITFRAHDPAAAYQVPIGRSLTVYARADGTIPDSAQVLDLIQGQEPLARRMFSVPGNERVFAYEFLDVRRPFSFVVRGGDDDDDLPKYHVEITIPPRVLSIQSQITYPDYLQRAPEQVADGSVTVPEGSHVEVTFTADLEIAKAQAVLGEETIAARPTDGSARRTFTFSYDAVRSLHGRLLLRTPDGKENDPTADSFDVRVKIDQPPRVDWIWPRTGLEVTPGGRVPLLVQAGDDHGVTALAVEMRVNTEDPRRFELSAYREDADQDGELPLEVNDGAFRRRRVLTYVPVEIKDLRTKDGTPVGAADGLAFRFVATDSRGQLREGDWTRVDVGSAAALERGLATQRSNVRLALESVRREQKSRRDDVAALVGAPLGRAELDLLKTVRFAQGKIAQDADRAVQELIGIFNGFIYDRLGSQNPNTKILAFLDRHHRATYGLEADRSDEPAVRPARGEGDWKGDSVFPYALYDDIIQAWRNKVIFDKGLLDKMCSAIAGAVEIGSRLSPRVHRAAAAAVGGEEASVRALLVAQEKNLNALDALLEAMRGWQSLSDMTIWLRGIIEEQKVLIREMEKRDGAPKKKRGNR